ncbi:MAG: PAS domain S-box protein [Spirochaetes bacterium]|nr:PAS domain S-box protein [Spirochaetota bacterium]
MERNYAKTVILLLNSVPETIIRCLAGSGYTLRFEQSAVPAIKADALEDISLVLINSDNINNFNFYETASSILNIKKLPVIFVTSEFRDDLISKTENLLHFGYISAKAEEFIIKSAVENALKIHKSDLFQTGKYSSMDITPGINPDKHTAGDLLTNEEVLFQVFNIINDPVTIIQSDDGICLFVNRGFTDLIGLRRSEVVGHCFSDFRLWVDPSVRNIMTAAILEKGYIDSLESDFYCADGKIITILLSAKLINFKGKNCIITISRDITERKNYEEILKKQNDQYAVLTEEYGLLIKELEHVQHTLTESEEKYRTIVQNSHEIIFTVLQDGTFTYVSPGWTKLLGHDINEILSHNFREFIHEDDCNEFFNFLNSFSGTSDLHVKQGFNIEYRVYNSDDQLRWHHSALVPLYDDAGDVIYFVGNAIDFTDKKNAGDESAKLLAEKEILLKEVHHRIKNNMNIMTSLLSLQINSLDDPASVKALTDARNRLHSMSVLYEKLYRNDAFREMSVKAYLVPLINEIASNFECNTSVNLEVDIEDFSIEVKNLSYLGIILNEILTNIMKYAFPEKTDCSVEISLRRKDNLIIMEVSDNGIGLPDNFSLEHSSGFGFRLIEMLTKQFNGNFEVNGNNGTYIRLEFFLCISPNLPE